MSSCRRRSIATGSSRSHSRTSPARPGRKSWPSAGALRPAATTDRWQRLGNLPTQAALDRLSVIEAANPEEESLAIAVALREVLETPGKTAALITPDRGLARRVLAALERWKVAVDDSGGD